MLVSNQLTDLTENYFLLNENFYLSGHIHRLSLEGGMKELFQKVKSFTSTSRLLVYSCYSEVCSGGVSYDVF